MRRMAAPTFDPEFYFNFPSPIPKFFTTELKTFFKLYYNNIELFHPVDVLILSEFFCCFTQLIMHY